MYNFLLGATGNGCTADEYRCQAAGTCIPAEWICDGEADCPGIASDEEKCEGNCYQYSSSNTQLSMLSMNVSHKIYDCHQK